MNFERLLVELDLAEGKILLEGFCHERKNATCDGDLTMHSHRHSQYWSYKSLKSDLEKLLY